MLDFPIWVWVVTVPGVIAAGIGLGYLLIYLFWRIERYIFPEPVVPEIVEPEIKVKEPPPPPPVEEEVVAIIKDAIPSGGNRIKLAYTLGSHFNHPFNIADTIICWNLTLGHGDEVRDTEGKQMKMQVSRVKGETERIQYILTDKSGHHTVSVIPAKKYLEQKTGLKLDKVTIS